MTNDMRRPSRETPSTSVQSVIMASKRDGAGQSSLRRSPYPDNLLEDILRTRSLNCRLESVGYPQFLVKLYRRAMHSKRVMA